MSQAGINSIASQSGIVFSAQGTAPIQVNGVSGVPESGNITISISNPYTPLTYTTDGILYGNSTGAILATAAANDAVLITSNAGVPSLLANGTTGQVLTATTGSPPSWQAAGGGGGITEFFSTYLSAPTGSVTGNGTLYGPILFDGIITNSSSSYNAGTGLYTAPSTGQYFFSHTVAFNGGDALTTSYITVFDGTGFSIRAFQDFPTALVGSNTTIYSSSIFIQLTAGATIGVKALAAGTNLNMAIFGAAPSALAVTSLFSGFKVA